MILIADSGSTKATWSLSNEGKIIQEVNASGINPYFQSEEEISNDILNALLPQLNVDNKEIKSVHFYGAGCTFDKIEVVRNAIQRHIPADTVEVSTDLLAVARGVCGKEAGIACILGTGSNSCYYDGEKIVKNISPLGFILGDEGSGASLGKYLVGDLLKDMMPKGLKEKFLEQYSLTPAIIIDRAYRQPFPNRFLASLSPFLLENIHEPAIKQLVYSCFNSFFIRNVMKYDYKKYNVSFVGSIAFYYKDILEEVAKDVGIMIEKIVKSPMEGLISYHSV